MRKYGFVLTKVHASHSGYKIDGTDLCVERFEAKKYGAPAEWDVIECGMRDRALVTGKSLDDALWRLARIRDLLPRAKDCPVKGAACGLYADTMQVEQEDDDG